MGNMIATRKSFGKALAALGEKYENIVCLDADLSKSTMSKNFAEKFPARFIEMGIQEANMIGAAAGLSFSGKIPFICSFGAFLTGRYDQIRMSLGYSNANVKVIGTHSGVGIGEDGHSQMGLEDLSLMRAIPNMVVLQPATDKETFEMMEWAVKYNGPVYFRLTRQDLAQFEQEPFKLGFWPKLREGKRVAFIGSGGPLGEAMIAATELANLKKMDPAVFNGSSIKPIDSKFLTELAKNYEEFVVFEDHSIIGGLGSALCEWMSEHAPTPRRVKRYGILDTFGESGTPNELLEHHGLLAKKIVKYFSN